MKKFCSCVLIVIILLCIIYNNKVKIEKEYYMHNKKKLKSTNNTPTEYNKMVLSNSNGDLSSIGCPKGVIWLWSGSLDNIPEGWALCNGENNTPDLRGRFVLGVNPNSKKNSEFTVNEMVSKGGEETVKLEVKHLPRHTHQDYFNETGAGGDGAHYNSGGYRLRKNGNIGFTGEDRPHNNMPPYYTLAYIMKTL